MSNDSLLRLFNSEFFNTWIAVSYLFKHYYNDDIIHYLCNALKTLPSVEIEYFLPQLIHLLISKPTLSGALGHTLMDLWKRSPHFAVMSIWHLQTYLSDLSSEPTSPSYLLCQRMLNNCQTSLLMENVDEMDRMKTPQQQNTKASSAVVKMGFGRQLWATPNTTGQHDANSTLGQKIANNGTGDTYVMDNNNNNSSSIHDTASSRSSPRQYPHLFHRDDIPSDSHMTTSSTNPFSFTLSLEDLHGGDAFSLSRYFSNHMKRQHHKSFQHMRRAVSSDGVMANSNNELDYHYYTRKKNNVMGLWLTSNSNNSSNNENDLSSQYNHLRHSLSSSYLSTIHIQKRQYDDITICGHHHSLPPLEHSSSSSPSTSSPFLSPRPSSPISNSNSNSNKPQSSLFENQGSRSSGYFQYEMQFLVTLLDIAERLVVLPKCSRGNALHAELTLLNHNLPAEICLPLWCSGSCSSLHHRVVRVSPSDAVVLNSAERAPYLLMIEVLDDDMCLEYQDNSKSSDRNGSSATETDKTTAAVVDKCDTIEFGRMDTLSPSTDFSRQMRTVAVLLAQLQQQDANNPTQVMVHAIRQRVIDQMVALEEERIKASSSSTITATPAQLKTTNQLYINTNNQHKKNGGGSRRGSKSALPVLKQESRTMVVNKDDPSAAVLSEAWQVKMARIRKNSPFGHLPNWRLLSVIVKQGADLRQEQFTLQLIREMQKIWQDVGVDAWVKYYRVLVTSENSGLIEAIRNTVSVHSIKKNAHTNGQGNSRYITLRDFFKQQWGSTKSTKFKAAQVAFLKSLAGYSIACYLLQIKDRHNGNLLLDDQGHLIHIDFGFVLSNSPGSVGFEMAPFKLSQEYIDVLGGMNSELFDQYRSLTKQAFKALRRHGDTIMLLVEMMSKNSNLPCFKNNSAQVLLQLKERFQFNLTDRQLDMYVDKLISSSCGNMFTRLYDTYQYYSQGIL